MKVKNLIKALESQDPEDEIVMKNLYCNHHESAYVMKNVRVYKWKNEVIIDGYNREFRDGN